MPLHDGSYDGKGYPSNFLHLFESAIRMQKWAMLVVCHMFTYTCKDSARNGRMVKRQSNIFLDLFIGYERSLVEFLSTDLPTSYKDSKETPHGTTTKGKETETDHREDHGHDTNDYRELRHQIEEAGDRKKENKQMAPVEAPTLMINSYLQELSEELSNVHNTFHVSNLKKCLSDESLIIPMKELRLDDKLNFVEEPIEIMDREVKQLRQSRIPIVKVRWNSKRGPEFTWEREDQIRAKYPHLFPNITPTSN
ncbi:hypothetical protein Tco_1040058 [Tanacetum coccineum]